ncbi:cellulose binding domain-containing protein [Actinomycetes bacterium KLBMP 9797]
MKTRALLVAVLAALVAGAAGIALRPAHADVTTAAPVRIMPLGDSITGSPGCWRASLWSRLQSNGFTNIDFVGTLPPQGCAIAHDGDNEGHGGALATTVADQNQLVGWLATARPDVVLMHFGTNDVWSARSTDTVLAAYGKLVDQMRASNPSMRILVAQIIPMDSARSCAECAQRVVSLNNAIPGWAAGKTTAASPITVVDQWTGFSTASDTYDGVHPNSAGDTKIANKWYPALTAALGNVPPPTTPPATTAPPTTPPPTSAPPTTPPPAGCPFTYRIIGYWQGGFQAEIIVRNGGTAPIAGWTIAFRFTAGEQISQLWGGQGTQNGASVTIQNVSYNGSLAPGATTTVGFIGRWSGSGPPPPVAC